MKKSYIGIILLISGMLVGAFGVMQKIRHAPNADTIRTVGTIVCVIGLLVYSLGLFYKKKN
jgi:uncharacterized membrane protein